MCKPKITFYSKAGCKVASLNGLWKWFDNNKWPMFAVFLGVGFFVCFFGRRLFKPMLFIVGVLVSVSLVWLIFYSTFLKEDTKSWVGWVVLGCSFLLGLIIGCVLMKLAKLGAFLLAAWGGFSLALLIYNAFLYFMHS